MNTIAFIGGQYRRRSLVPKRANTIFHDEELLVTLPSAWTLFHIDDARAPWSAGWSGTKVDWAWEEAGAFYLCELKDPECAGALSHPAPPGKASHVAAMVTKLIDASFPNEFATNVRDTLANHPQAAAAANYRFIVVAAISDPNFNSAVAGPASLIIRRQLVRMGLSMPVAVLNIAAWNTQLSPRTIQRAP